MGLFNYKHPSLKEYYEGHDGIQQSGDELYRDYQFTSLADVIYILKLGLSSFVI